MLAIEWKAFLGRELWSWYLGCMAYLDVVKKGNSGVAFFIQGGGHEGRKMMTRRVLRWRRGLGWDEGELGQGTEYKCRNPAPV